MTEFVVLSCVGALAGLIDSAVGGGGLITLPALILALGPGARAVGSNKIPGFIAAFVALVVYWRKGHLWWRTGIVFSVGIALGALCGSRVSPLLPAAAFRVLLLVTAPLVLASVFLKPLWTKRQASVALATDRPQGRSLIALLGIGAIVGFYDGAWGPGGGTFMFLGLLLGTPIPLLPAMATAKLANSASALSSLVSYWSQDLVSVRHGIAVAMGSVMGAAAGARLAHRWGERLVRPALVAISALLLLRVFNS